MAGISMRAIGVRELDYAFRSLANSVGKQGRQRMVEAGAEVILAQAKDNIRATFEIHSGHLLESGHVETSNAGAEVVFDAVYAAVHEYGLPNQPITDRQRRFFWAMWYEERDSMWKALALSETYTIPARPYLRPAFDTAREKAISAMAKTVRTELRRATVLYPVARPR